MCVNERQVIHPDHHHLLHITVGQDAPGSALRCCVRLVQVYRLIMNLIVSISSLFDMDGTLVDSTAGVVGAWEVFAESYPGIKVDEILSCTPIPLVTD